MYFVKRNKIFHLFYTDELGKQKSISTKCSSKNNAQQFALKFFSAKDQPKEKLTPYTYKEFKELYLGYASSRFSQSYQEFVEITFKQFGKVVEAEKMLADITTLDVERFIALKRKAVGERIVNGYLRTLQGAFERAIEFGMLDKNIFKRIKKLTPPKNLPVFFTKEDFDILLQHEDQAKFRFIYRFALYTGMRMGEIRFLKWESINFSRDLITVHNHETFTTKSKRSRDIPLHSSLKEELINTRGKPDEYVFLSKHRQYTKSLLSNNFKAVVRKAKLNDKYHFHTLRHTFASWLVQAGVSIYEVSKLLGHADIKTTQIYAHLRSDDLRRSVELLN